MITVNCLEIERTYKNFGMHAEQALCYTLTGELRKHDRVRYDIGSDIPEYDMSVKSSKFTLMSGKLAHADTFEGIVEEFFANVHSERFAYVTQSMKAYIMDKETFKEFVYRFCELGRESQKKGGNLKVRMKAESCAVLVWLAIKTL